MDDDRAGADGDLYDWEEFERRLAELTDLPPSERARRFDEWRRTLPAKTLIALALAFQQVFEPERERKVEIVQEDTGALPPDGIDVSFGASPSETVVVLRPWLLGPRR